MAKRNVLPFTKRYAVTQLDLEEERELTRQATEALRRVEQKRKQIKAALSKHGEIEPGPRWATITDEWPDPYLVCPKRYKKLTVE